MSTPEGYVSAYWLRRLKVCVSCKHGISAHEYVPDNTVKGQGPKHCQVPGCLCLVFVWRVRR